MAEEQEHVRRTAVRRGPRQVTKSRGGSRTDFPGLLGAVQDEIALVLGGVDPAEEDRLAREMLRTSGSGGRVYVAGSGRSGLVAASFAMRLVHLGFATHVVGESTAPGIERGDLLVMASGSGRTRTAVAQVAAARNRGALPLW